VNADAKPSGPLSINCSMNSAMVLSSLVCIRFSWAKERTGMETQCDRGHGPGRTEQNAQKNLQTSGCTTDADAILESIPIRLSHGIPFVTVRGDRPACVVKSGIVSA